MKKTIILIFLFSFSCFVFAVEQLPYEIEKDRFSFAQLYLSIDYSQYSITSPLHSDNTQKSSLFVPSVTIGGLHYWGMADFFVTIPIPTDDGTNNLSYRFSPGIETGFKYYPEPIANRSFRGFVGGSFSFPSYRQKTSINGEGAEQTKILGVGQLGVSYTYYPFMFDFGVKYSPQSNFDYYISPVETKEVDYSDFSLYISGKWLVDTTLSGRKENRGNLDLPKGIYPYIGIGPSSAWSIKNSAYVDNSSPYLDIKNDPTVFPELSAGVHWKNFLKKGYRTIFNISYRPQKFQKEGFNTEHAYSNNSLAFEVFQSFWDYHGFVPFLGVSYAINQLEFTEETANATIKRSADAKVLGAIFGWDILPTHQSSWFLRTTLRYYPEIIIETNQGKVQFPNLEFNFIQFIYQF